VKLPPKLETRTNAFVVGLVASAERIAQVRQNRVLEHAASHLDAYVDREAIAAEIAETRQLCARRGWPVIDVTRRSIEETAAAILRLYHDRGAPVLDP
jgi:regulator of PEP synthase PpsR (kinase-PPPase family)